MDEVLIGDRVLVEGRLGVVRFAGVTEFCEGWWYGIELEDNVGFNDGSVQGKRYFDLQHNQGSYGIFAQLEDIRKIDDGGALVDENRKLLKVVEALERKIKQRRLKRDLSAQEETASNLQEAVNIFQRENSSLKAEISSLQDKMAKVSVTSSEEEDKRLQMAEELNAKLTSEISELRKENDEQKSMLGVYAEIEEELRSQLSYLEQCLNEEKIVESIKSLMSSQS